MKHFATVSYLRMMFQEFIESDCESRLSTKKKQKKNKKTNEQKSKQNEYFKNVNFIIFFFSQ